MSRHHAALGKDQGRLRRRCLDRDDWRCTEPGCGSPVNLEMHHTIPLDKGGQNVIDNVRMVCASHHIEIHRHGDPERAAWCRLLWEGV